MPVYQLEEPSNPPFSKKEMATAISKLQSLGAISQCVDCADQFISPIFLIPKSDGSQRFILNLKKLNKFITKQHFKMEDIRTATKLIFKKAFMCSIDLKEAYFLVPIHTDYKKYLRFRLDDKLFEFNCLPFGLSSAPFVFTKLLKPVLTELRRQGHTIVAYLDDLLCINNNYWSCLSTANSVIDILEKLGFVINYEKSVLIPSKHCRYLGMIINTSEMILELPREKRDKISVMLNTLSKKSQISIRDFAKFLGTLTAACPAVAYGWTYTKIFERDKYLALLKYEDYDTKMHIGRHLQTDFQWWARNIQNTFNPIRTGNFEIEIFTDASLTGWGSVCNDEVARGHWSATESKNHINYLELLAAYLGLKSFCESLSNTEILLRIDNTTAIAYINKMGGIQFPHLNQIAREIWQWCEARNLYIFASYIKSKENVEADKASRHSNIDTEWDLNGKCFQKLLNKFGQPKIDLFASRLNKKCNMYVSWKRDPEAFDIDAFTLRWNQYYFYAFPPFAIILKCLRKIINDKATGIFIAPHWPCQPWYPLFTSMVVSEIIYFNPDKNLLLSPCRECHPLWPSLTLVCAVLSGKHM